MIKYQACRHCGAAAGASCTWPNGAVREPHAGREQVRRGGYRGTSKRARYTAQLVALETPETASRVRALEQGSRSMGDVMREIVAAGLPVVEARYAATEYATVLEATE